MDLMIRDRGNIKWTAMMLPEHVKLLREYKEHHGKAEKPFLDEQKYEEFNERICGAMEENRRLRFTSYQGGKLIQTAGRVHYMDEARRELRILDSKERNVILKVRDIIEIEEE
jgi:hypothetical protein